MNADNLNAFLSVYRSGGFSAAAETLNLTQPAVSHRIQALERDLGVQLFDRTSRGVVLSQAGRELLPHAERVLAALSNTQKAMRALGNAEGGAISIAVVGTLADRIFAGVLNKFAGEFPRVEVSLQTARSAEVGELVRRGTADLGLRYQIEPATDLASEELAREPLLVVCSKHHPLAGKSIDALRMLRDERWLAFPETPRQPEISAQHVFAVFLTLGAGEVRWTPVDSLTAQLRLVESGYGIALMTRSNVRDELSAGRVKSIRVCDLRAAMPIVAVTRSAGFVSPAMKRMLNLMRTAYGQV
jgi:DNA-binding transcriptional LysR family regulator